MRDLDDDYYDFDEKNYCLVGRRRHHVYQLGDPIRIKVAKANLERKQLDFTLDDGRPVKVPQQPVKEQPKDKKKKERRRRKWAFF